MTDSSDIQLFGFCLCKAVRYMIRGAPLTAVVCHCTHCQRASGSVFESNVVCRKDQVTILQGQDSIKDYKDQAQGSGGVVIRSFCSECGCNLFNATPGGSRGSDIMTVTSGTLDEASKAHARPQVEYFTRRRRDWVKVYGEGMVEHETVP